MLMRTLSAGDQIVKLVEHCYASKQPLLLCGPHGIGKSELFKTAAKRLGIQFISRDLSLMEPPDLVGVPYIEEGRTHFAAPSFLPEGGCGLLAIEEINRAPRYMWTACLQLLTERRFNDYEIPPGWMIAASMNPSGENYQVDQLDDALTSRFVQATIRADVNEWTQWARKRGDVHQKVIEFAEQSPEIFEPGEANPRSLTYLSRSVQVWEENGRESDILLAAASGLVGETWAIPFYQFLTGGEAPLSAAEIIDDYKRTKPKLTAWSAGGQLDLIRATIHQVKRFLEKPGNAHTITDNEKRIRNVHKFLEDLPADLRVELRSWLSERNLDVFGD